jgi:hypothetical protein
MNRMVFDMACTMLDSPGAPADLWAEAASAAAHIRNGLPWYALDGMTLHEAWTGQKLTVKHICKWECKVYHHINKIG